MEKPSALATFASAALGSRSPLEFRVKRLRGRDVRHAHVEALVVSVELVVPGVPGAHLQVHLGRLPSAEEGARLRALRAALSDPLVCIQIASGEVDEERAVELGRALLGPPLA